MDVNEILADSEIQAAYAEYLRVTEASPLDYDVQSLESIALNVTAGERKGYPIRDCVLSCLRALIFHRSTPLSAQIEMAEASEPERRANMTPEQRAACDRYRLPSPAPIAQQ